MSLKIDVKCILCTSDEDGETNSNIQRLQTNYYKCITRIGE